MDDFLEGCLIGCFVRILIKAFPYLLVIALVIWLAQTAVFFLGNNGSPIPESELETEPQVEQCTREVPLIHTVQRGDTLLELAEDYDICITTLVECHKKEYPDITKELIREGWQLNMPPPICEATPPSQREEEKCMVEAINDYISEEEPDSPLKGYGERFVYWGRVCNVDPRLIVAIARKESELGTKPCANHNAWGIRPRGVCKDFDSWEAGIRYATKNIVRLHFCYYEKHTVKDMDRYCTSNCKDWAGLVSQFMRDIEDGDPDNLTFKVFGQ